MEWLQSPAGKLPLSVIVGTGVVTWWKGILNEVLPSPRRVVLSLMNVLTSKTQAAEDRFRIVLCRLENDPIRDEARLRLLTHPYY